MNTHLNTHREFSQKHSGAHAAVARPRFLRAVLAALCLFANASAFTAPTASDTAASAEAQAPLIDRLMRWLPGDYSSAEFMQAVGHADPAAQAAAKANTLTTYIRRVQMPALGNHVLFLEEYRGTRDPALERARLYVLEPGEDAGVTEILVVNPKDPESLIGARDRLSRVEALGPDDLRPDSAGCRLHFRDGVDGYVAGRMAYQGCRFGDWWVDYELQLGPADHWVCYSRRQQANDAVTWQLVPGVPCLRMVRQ